MDNRHSLVVGARVTHATGTAEREAATGLLAGMTFDGATVGADKLYDTHEWDHANTVVKAISCRPITYGRLVAVAGQQGRAPLALTPKPLPKLRALYS